jgi:hypothetical protein
MTAPIMGLAERLRTKGFLKGPSDLMKPASMPELIPLSVKDLILRFRTILSGFLNYYSFVDNREALGKIY